MITTRSRHRVMQHRTGMPGVEALSIASDRAFPRHSHDGYGIGVLLFGGHRSWSGIGAVAADPGDLITVNPGEIHDGLPVACGIRGWRVLYLDPAAMLRQTAGDVHGDIEIARPAIRDAMAAALVLRAVARLAEPIPDPLAAEEGLAAALMRVLERHGVRPPRPPAHSPPISRALQRMDDAPARPTTLAELAAVADLSRFQLLRGFTREVGTTPHAYLLQRRVRLARRMLIAGMAPAEAAAQAGFADQSHLTRAFVRQFGITPGRYRAAAMR